MKPTDERPPACGSSTSRPGVVWPGIGPRRLHPFVTTAIIFSLAPVVYWGLAWAARHGRPPVRVHFAVEILLAPVCFVLAPLVALIFAGLGDRAIRRRVGQFHGRVLARVAGVLSAATLVYAAYCLVRWLADWPVPS